jgi:hypothetical protein
LIRWHLLADEPDMVGRTPQRMICAKHRSVGQELLTRRPRAGSSAAACAGYSIRRIRLGVAWTMHH